MKTMLLSEAAFWAIQNMLACEGKYFFPPKKFQKKEAAEFFLQGRKFLCDAGYLEMDFDGSLIQSPEFGRMIYNLKKPVSVMQYQGKESVWFLQGSVDFLRIREVKGEYEFSRCDSKVWMNWLQKDLYQKESGLCRTEHGGKVLSEELAQTPKGTKERAEVLAKQLCLFRGLEAKDA